MHLAEARIRNIAIEADTGCRQDQGSTLPRFPEVVTAFDDAGEGVEEFEAGLDDVTRKRADWAPRQTG